MDDETLDAGIQRRKCFRIYDEIILQYRKLSSAEILNIDSSKPIPVNPKFALAARFAATNAVLKPAMHCIRNESKAVAKYLEAIDQKLNLLAELMLEDVADISSESTQEVNISAGGLSFGHSKALEDGSMLEVYLILFPSNTGILTYAKVVHCKQRKRIVKGGNAYSIGIEFTHISDEDADLISQHVLSKQSMRLCRRNRSTFS